MRIFTHVVRSIAVAAMAAPAFASNSSPGFVINPTPTNNNVIYFTQDGTRTAAPACATDPRYIIDPSASGAASIYAALLTAAAAGRQITVQGTGACLSGSSNETVAWISIVS